MASYSKIQAALANKALLFAQANSVPIYFDNQKYEPPLKKKHIRAFFIPGESFQAACGEDAPNKQTGVYIFNIYTELQIGYGEAFTLVDKLVTEFKRGTKIVKDTLEITCSKTIVEAYDTNESWYIVPVSVLFYSYTPNS